MKQHASMTTKPFIKVLLIAGLIVFQPLSIAAQVKNTLESAAIASCQTSLTETIAFGDGIANLPDFTSQSNGGRLCTGTYSGNAYCLGVTGGDCGGGSCGWLLSLKNNLGVSLATQVYHTGGLASYKNLNENDTQYVYLQLFTINTATNAGLYITGWLDGGGYYSYCTMTVQQISS